MKPRYLLNSKTGVRFVWTEELASRGDLTPIYEDDLNREEGELICPTCGKRFKTKKALAMHIVRMHPKEDPQNEAKEEKK